jgi:CheY-like chemotaxis protein
LSSRPAVVRKRHTAPGIAIDVDVTSDAAEAAKTPRRSVMPAPRRPTQDPRRLTLGYEAVVDDPAVGHGSRPCALVAMTDPTLRAVVARILRREGFGVVTAPEGSLGAVLAERFDAAILVVDSRGAPRTSGDVPSELLPPMIWLDVEPDNPPALASDARALRLAAKPLDPSSLVSAIEQLMPAGWRG